MPEAEDPFAHTRMTLGEHLAELRKRLLRSVVTLVVTFGGALFFQDPITSIVLRPHREAVRRFNEECEAQARDLVEQDPSLQEQYFEPDGSHRFRIDPRLESFAPTEAMWFVLKMCGYFALFVGSPVFLWQLWQFVAAGLYERERKWVRGFFVPAFVLFVLGVLFSYYLLVPYGLFYLLKTTPIDLVKPSIRLEFYFSFLATLSLGMGLIFQLPMLMTFLGTLGIVAPATFARLRGYFVIAAFFIAAILTPGPDIFSQTVMAVPMIVLYEIGILGGRLGARRRARHGQAAP